MTDDTIRIPWSSNFGGSRTKRDCGPAQSRRRAPSQDATAHRARVRAGRDGVRKGAIAFVIVFVQRYSPSHVPSRKATAQCDREPSQSQRRALRSRASAIPVAHSSRSAVAQRDRVRNRVRDDVRAAPSPPVAITIAVAFVSSPSRSRRGAQNASANGVCDLARDGPLSWRRPLRSPSQLPSCYCTLNCEGDRRMPS